MTERPTRAEVAVRGLARLMRRTGSGAVSATAHARGRARLLATLEANQAAGRLRPWWVGAAVGAALAVVVLLLVPLVVPAPESLLAFTIDGAPPGQSYVHAGPSGAAAHFSEGTVVTLGPGARGRVVGVTTHGARINVESGAAHFEVVHRPGAEWLAEAGPFLITVTGTSFDLGWNGAELEVVMGSGSVIVRGPPARDGIALRAGQRLVADAARVEVSLLAAPVAASAAPNASAIAPGLASAPSPPSPRPSALPPPLPWRARVAGGDFAGVIAEAEARGLDASIDGSPLADLGALADAARYAGRGDLAQRALIAERTRFRTPRRRARRRSSSAA